MSYAKAIPINNLSYNPSKFEVKVFNASDKIYNSVKNGLKEGIQKAKNTFNYISEIAFPENKFGKVVVDKANNVYDNLHKENVNARGHLIHWTDKEREIYNQKEVKEFIQYLKSKGKKVADINGYEAVNNKDGGVIAAVHTDPLILNAIPTIGTDFFKNIAFEARHNKTTAEIVKLYVALHEISHTISNPKNIFYNIIYNRYPFAAEKFVEKQVYEYAIKKAEEVTSEKEKSKWLKIAEIAENRYKNVKENYSKRKLTKSKEKNIEEKVQDEKGNKDSKGKSKESKYEGKNSESKYEGKQEQENVEEGKEAKAENLENIVEGEQGEVSLEEGAE